MIFIHHISNEITGCAGNTKLEKKVLDVPNCLRSLPPSASEKLCSCLREGERLVIPVSNEHSTHRGCLLKIVSSLNIPPLRLDILPRI